MPPSALQRSVAGGAGAGGREAGARGELVACEAYLVKGEEKIKGQRAKGANKVDNSKSGQIRFLTF
jgi:hypothetical protein